MSKGYTPIFYRDSPDLFLDAMKAADISGVPGYAQFALNSAYYHSYFGDDFEDISFCLEKAGTVHAFCLLHKYGENACGYFGHGASIYLLEENKKTVSTIYETLVAEAARLGMPFIRVGSRGGDCLDLVGGYAFNAGGDPSVRLQAAVDLTQSEETIHRSLRQSYKALVNQGIREFEWLFATKENPDEALFAEFKAFHQKEAGRKTRSDESWERQLDMIRAGEAELVAGMLEGSMVSSALFIDHGPETIYAVAVYDRSLFDKPLAHGNVYTGLMRAKERGQEKFFLGDIPSHGSVSDKEYNIGKFKKGFCSALTISIDWKIPVSPARIV